MFQLHARKSGKASSSNNVFVHNFSTTKDSMCSELIGKKKKKKLPVKLHTSKGNKVSHSTLSLSLSTTCSMEREYVFMVSDKNTERLCKGEFFFETLEWLTY